MVQKIAPLGYFLLTIMINLGNVDSMTSMESDVMAIAIGNATALPQVGPPSNYEGAKELFIVFEDWIFRYGERNAWGAMSLQVSRRELDKLADNLSQLGFSVADAINGYGRRSRYNSDELVWVTTAIVLRWLQILEKQSPQQARSLLRSPSKSLIRLKDRNGIRVLGSKRAHFRPIRR